MPMRQIRKHNNKSKRKYNTKQIQKQITLLSPTDKRNLIKNTIKLIDISFKEINQNNAFF
jgi:hypothetical protein